MTIFATQNSNLVFASPDGSNGTPDFRALTANDLPASIIKTSLTRTSNLIISGSTPTYVTPTLKLAANTIQAGDTYKMTLCTDNSGYTIYTVKFGPYGNVSDANLLYVATTAVNALRDFYVTFKTLGGNVTVVAIMSDISGFVDQAHGGGVDGQVGNTYNVSTTTDNYLGLVFYGDASSSANVEMANIIKV